MTTNEIDFQFIPNREVRQIPKGWQHPKDAAGKHIPLLPADYTFDDAEHAAGAAGLMPTPGTSAEIAAYETTTEGTPISPPFPNTPEGRRALVAYCAEHAFVFGHRRAGGEAWAAVLFGEGATVDGDGTVRA
ncbi:MAG: hypothetical protein HY874_07695 [Chloroflexi bacterium]|nr:hypothetical protein [Chloroflexota bacterium]